MFQQMRGMWQSGLEGRHIEEIIGNIFADFAPYAGADQQHVTITRQHGVEATSSLVLSEEPAEVAASFTHVNVGCVGFSTNGAQQADMALRIPITSGVRRPISKHAAQSSEETPSSSSPSSSSVFSPWTTTRATQGPLRFISSSARGAQLLLSLPRTCAGTPEHINSMGQLEIEGNLLEEGFGRRALGLRLGPFSARITSIPMPKDPRQDHTRDTTSVTDASATSIHAPPHMHTIDVSLCVPFTGGDRVVPSKDASDTNRSDSGKEPEALTRAPWALLVGLQHPFTVGDTIAAVSLQTDCLNAFAKRDASLRDSTDHFHPCLPLYSSPAVEGEAVSLRGMTKFDVSPTALRFLLVQTLASRAFAPIDSTLNSSSSFLSATRRVISASDKSWYQLPTLVGCNISFAHDLLKLSAASIFHDGSADLETAVVLDATPVLPSVPTLLKVGWNNAGRLALGVTSMLFDAATLTLGVHVTRGESMRFGLEIKM